MKPTASGENRNWPNEPAAVPRPKASERHSGGISLPNAPSTSVNERRRGRSRSARRPRDRAWPAWSEKAISARPAAYSSAPTLSTRSGAETIGDRAGERLTDAPEQILDRQRQARTRRGPSRCSRHRRQEQAERRARPEADRADQAAADQDHQRRAPARNCRSARRRSQLSCVAPWKCARPARIARGRGNI